LSAHEQPDKLKLTLYFRGLMDKIGENKKRWQAKGNALQTFVRLSTEHDAFVGVSLAEMERRFGMLRESILDWI
jgi:hypothetical protein